ncbi:competence protein ComEC [Terracoccus luteus]|uniref:Competence protein ComEC n=1 Tax=Terracoccus luteus TaxID=53356 RepID=A0A495XZD7_9MICO|nr:ComEC/Rec2 family competence protein [Terracoccus luteus]RKT77098.1 competence protein ComEC [Terracoccus luteus]
MRLLLPVAVAWPVVAFWALLAERVVVVATGAVCGAGALVLLRRSRRPGAGAAAGRRVAGLLALGLATLALLLVAVSGHRALRATGPVDELADARAVVTLRAALATEPRVIGGGPSEAGDTAAGGGGRTARALVVVELDVHRVTGRGRTTDVSVPVLVIGGPEWARLHWRDEVEVVARLGPPDPGDRVVAVASPRGSPRLLGGPPAVFAAADHVRERFRSATEHLPADARGLVPALVVGDTTATPADLTDAMLTTGMSHLSAVSGSNVTMVLVAAVGLCRLLALPRRWRPWGAGTALAAFVVLARPEPSVIRAAVMGVVGLLALSTSRRRAGVPALAGAVVVLLVYDPWLSRSYGFALSSVATLGLLLFAGPWATALGRVLPRRLRWLGAVLAVPVAAQVVCAPVVVPLQGAVSIVAVLANLLAAPLVAPTTMAGVAVALLSVVSVGLAGWLAWAAAVPALGIAWVARTCATAPFATLAWGDSALAALGLALLTAAAVLAAPWAWRRARLRPLVAGAVVVTTTALAVPTTTLAWPPPGWVAVACDVGQGDALVLANGPGHAVVVDAGPDPRLVDGCLDRLGVEVVDLVVLSHFHADHVRGLAGVLDGRAVRAVRASTVDDPPGEARQVARLVTDAGLPLERLRAGDDLAVGGVRAHVWWPAREIDAGSVANNASVVLTVHLGGVGLLLLGDVEREAAGEVVRALARDPTGWAGIDVVKVAHHGSSNRDDRLLDGAPGRLALVSVGADNDYGHPAPATLDALSQRGFRVHRTDLEGDLAVVDDGDGLRVVASG